MDGSDATRLTDPDLLRGQMEPIHAAWTGLLPAIQVAWADGVVQERERALILRLAEESGLARDAAAMSRILGWLEAPPSESEARAAIAELRAAHTSGGGDPVELARIIDWARAVARADGGVLGLAAISKDERNALDALESALTDGAAKEAPGWRRAALEVMRDLLIEQLEADTTHVDLVPRDVRTTWPHPSPWDAKRMPPAVFGIEEREHRDFMTGIIGRYVRSLRDGWWDAVRHAVRARGVAPLDDRELARLVFETPFSRFLVPTLDAPDRARFAPFLPRDGSRVRDESTLYKVDHSHLASWRPLPGISVAPTVGLFSLEGGGCSPIAISVGDRTFGPEDGESWARARYFFLQGCSLSLVVGIHPFLHFPMDSVIAVTREVFPRDHALARLVEAHAYLHLPLDYGVSWNARSVAHNHQREVYTPYPARRDDIFRGIADCYAGIEGNSGYPGFRYPMSEPSFPGPYCELLARYHRVILAFCRRVVERVDRGDATIARWGVALHELLPGFPTPEALRDPDVLASALAGFVHSVSVWHSAEHHAYAAEPVSLVPQRLRVPVPTGGDLPIPREEWLRPVDVVRQEMARRMFYEAHTVRPILAAQYGWSDPALIEAARDFADALRACDRDQPRRYIDLDRIACSLQF